LSHGHAGLEAVEQGVVVGEPAGLLPSLAAGASRGGDLLHETFGDFDGSLDVPAGLTNLIGVVGLEIRASERLDALDQLQRRQSAVAQPGDGRHDFGSTLGALARHHRFLIPRQQLLRRIEIADLAPEEVKARQVERQWEDSDGTGTWEEGAELSSAASRGRSGYACAPSWRSEGRLRGRDMLTDRGEDQSTPSDLEYAGERDMSRFWREIRPRHEPLDKRWFLPSVLVLMVISVPWYLPPGFVGRLYGGLPVWIWIALVCSVVLAAITSFVALRSWRDDD
jgi:hypothetical protein